MQNLVQGNSLIYSRGQHFGATLREFNAGFLAQASKADIRYHIQGVLLRLEFFEGSHELLVGCLKGRHLVQFLRIECAKV
jgi:hypothetical protein